MINWQRIYKLRDHPEQITPELAAMEMLARRQARQTFNGFVHYTMPGYLQDPFHLELTRILQRVVDGLAKRVMIFAPPQHGKSEHVSVRLPAYWLAKRPNEPVVIASYAAELAVDKSREVRNALQGEAYSVLFGDRSGANKPIRIRQDSRAADRFSLDGYHGKLRAAGIHGALSGHAGSLGIIDDPFENWKTAQSASNREDVWFWYNSVFWPRISQIGTIVLIMTRWHEDDLAGRLLKYSDETWEVYRFPAIAETQEERDRNNKYLGLPIGEPDLLGREPGEPLAPSLHNLDDLRPRQKNSSVWASLYQGVPRPAEGDRFKRVWFKETVAVAPADARRVRYWDKAGTAGGGAYTAGVLVAMHKGLTYIEHVVRGQWSAMEREDTIKMTAQRDRRLYGSEFDIWIEQEPGSGGKESAENTIKNLVGYRIHKDQPQGNKDVRMEPFAAQAEAGNVRLVEADWNEDWLDEITSIPNGTYRDQGDATAGAFNKLALAAEDAAIYIPDIYGLFD